MVLKVKVMEGLVPLRAAFFLGVGIAPGSGIDRRITPTFKLLLLHAKVSRPIILGWPVVYLGILIV
jgi:hypothetical protein